MSRDLSHSKRAVVVLLGGPSAEHDVSIVSGSAVAEALSAAGHPVDRVVIDLEGRWWWLPGSGEPADRPGPSDGPSPAAFDDPAGLGAEGPFAASTILERLAVDSSPPVVFIALHGPFGEDGTVQALLEAADLP